MLYLIFIILYKLELCIAHFSRRRVVYTLPQYISRKQRTVLSKWFCKVIELCIVGNPRYKEGLVFLKFTQKGGGVQISPIKREGLGK